MWLIDCFRGFLRCADAQDSKNTAGQNMDQQALCPPLQMRAGKGYRVGEMRNYSAPERVDAQHGPRSWSCRNGKRMRGLSACCGIHSPAEDFERFRIYGLASLIFIPGLRSGSK